MKLLLAHTCIFSATAAPTATSSVRAPMSAHHQCCALHHTQCCARHQQAAGAAIASTAKTLRAKKAAVAFVGLPSISNTNKVA